MLTALGINSPDPLVCRHVHTHTHTYTHTHTHAHTHTYTHTRTQTHAHTHAHRYTHTHTCRKLTGTSLGLQSALCTLRGNGTVLNP